MFDAEFCAVISEPIAAWILFASVKVNRDPPLAQTGDKLQWFEIGRKFPCNISVSISTTLAPDSRSRHLTILF